jgi:WD40 repeat protein
MTVVLFDATSGRELTRFKDNQRTCVSNAAAVSPDGKRLAVGQWESTVLIWDVSGVIKDGN